MDTKTTYKVPEKVNTRDLIFIIDDPEYNVPYDDPEDWDEPGQESFDDPEYNVPYDDPEDWDEPGQESFDVPENNFRTLAKILVHRLYYKYLDMVDEYISYQEKLQSQYDEYIEACNAHDIIPLPRNPYDI